MYAGDRARECVCAQMCVFFNRLSSGFHYPINFIRTHRCNITTIEIDQNDAKMHLSLFFYTGLPGVAYLDIVEEQHKDHVKMLAAGCGVTSSLLISPFLHRFVGHHPLHWYLLGFFLHHYPRCAHQHAKILSYTLPRHSSSCPCSRPR